MITGAAGMTGAEVVRQSEASGIECAAFTRGDLDISDADAVFAAVRKSAPDIVVNAAAYTAVDQAECDEEQATLVNGYGAGNVARAAAMAGAGIIHISTDYVFDGVSKQPYLPSDRTNPLGAYGRSKLAGEVAVRSAGGRHMIVRTSWVYSHEGRNFVRTMLRLASSGTELSESELRFGLRFISGKYQGGEYPLAEGQEIVVGRSSEHDYLVRFCHGNLRAAWRQCSRHTTSVDCRVSNSGEEAALVSA